jgi:hypothetical protein
MTGKKPKDTKIEAKRYLSEIPRRAVYIPLAVVAVAVIIIFLFVPHYKPVHIASQNELQDAHKAIIDKYFLRSTTCLNDTRSKTDRIIQFNHYFKVNQYANRAVIRGCNDDDTLLATDDTGQWQRTDVNIVLSSRQNPQWQKACYIDDITVADAKVRPENSSIDANNLHICKSLAKRSYIELNWNVSVHFHF